MCQGMLYDFQTNVESKLLISTFNLRYIKIKGNDEFFQGKSEKNRHGGNNSSLVVLTVIRKIGI